MTAPPTAHLIDRVMFRESDHAYLIDATLIPEITKPEHEYRGKIIPEKIIPARIKGGTRVPSVTTILGNLAKPALVWWSARLGAEAARDRILEEAARLRQLGEDFGTETPESLEILAAECYQLARYAHRERKETAGKKGTAVHDAIQLYHEDFFQAAAPVEPAEEHAWAAFVAWWALADLECISTERVVVDPDGRYAGRLDMLCRNRTTGGLFVCDTKTSGGIYTEHVMQNAAYAAAIESELGQPVEGTMVLWLPDGCSELTVKAHDRDEWRAAFAEGFEPLLSVNGYLKREGKSIKLLNDRYKTEKDEA